MAEPTLRQAAERVVAVFENGIYFKPEPSEVDQGYKWRADAIRRQKWAELTALAELERAVSR